VSGRLANEINREEYTPSYSIESRLRRSSLNCQLAGRFSDLKLLRMHLRYARFNGNFTSADEAAQMLFGKPAASLGSEESIRLAATYDAPPVQNDPSKWARRIEYIRKRLEATTAE
jgi:membrane carboxypeptidase/penicillin-binding protein PbpC